VKDPTAEFFEGLSQGRAKELSPKIRATIRFDLSTDTDVQHWFTDIENGTIRVSREEREADCVIKSDKKLFDRLAEGKGNVFSAWFRNEIGLSGSRWLMTVLRHILPGPVGARDPGAAARQTGEGQ
jgi:predicted lipid carrier protein YhbT